MCYTHILRVNNKLLYTIPIMMIIVFQFGQWPTSWNFNHLALYKVNKMHPILGWNIFINSRNCTCQEIILYELNPCPNSPAIIKTILISRRFF